MYALINGIIIRTRAIYQIQITASLSDEDACTGSRELLKKRPMRDTIKRFAVIKENSTEFTAIFKSGEPFLGH